MFPLAAVAAAVVPYATLLFISSTGLVPDTADRHRIIDWFPLLLLGSELAVTPSSHGQAQVGDE